MSPAAITTDLLCLPDEMLVKIAANLSINEWYNLSLTCHKMERIVSANTRIFKTDVLTPNSLMLVPARVLKRHWDRDSG